MEKEPKPKSRLEVVSERIDYLRGVRGDEGAAKTEDERDELDNLLTEKERLENSQ